MAVQIPQGYPFPNHLFPNQQQPQPQLGPPQQNLYSPNNPLNGSHQQGYAPQRPPSAATLPIVPSSDNQDPPMIEFNGKNYYITPEIFGTKKTIPPSQKPVVAQLIAMTLKYAIPAFENETGIKINSLEHLKLIELAPETDKDTNKLKPYGQLLLKYIDPKSKEEYSIEIKSDELLLCPKDKETVCSLLPKIEGTHDVDYNNAKITYVQAMNLITAPTLECKFSSDSPDSPEKKPQSNSVTLKPLTYNELPEEYRKKHSEKTQEAKKPDEKPAPQKPSEEEKVKFPLTADSITAEEIKHLPIIPDESYQANGKLPDECKNYLLEGKLTASEKGSDDKTTTKDIELSYKPETFSNTEVADILYKLAKENPKAGNYPYVEEDFTKYSDKEKIFLKRLFIYIAQAKKNAPSKDDTEDPKDSPLGTPDKLQAFLVPKLHQLVGVENPQEKTTPSLIPCYQFIYAQANDLYKRLYNTENPPKNALTLDSLLKLADMTTAEKDPVNEETLNFQNDPANKAEANSTLHPRWIDYLLNGRFRIAQASEPKMYTQSFLGWLWEKLSRSKAPDTPNKAAYNFEDLPYSPTEFTGDEVVSILNKLKENNLQFNDKEKIFLKRFINVLYVNDKVSNDNNKLYVMLKDLVQAAAPTQPATFDASGTNNGNVNKWIGDQIKSLLGSLANITPPL